MVEFINQILVKIPVILFKKLLKKCSIAVFLLILSCLQECKQECNFSWEKLTVLCTSLIVLNNVFHKLRVWLVTWSQIRF